MAQTALITDEPLYDRVYILSTTSPLDLVFFAVPQGSADPNNNTVTKTPVETNMSSQGRMPNPESFDAYSIRLVPDLDASRADMVKLMNESYVEFRTSGNSIVAWRSASCIITAGTGFPYSGTDSPQLGYPAPQAILKFRRPIIISEGETFSVHLVFSSTPSLGANRKVRAFLEGDHYMVSRTDARVANVAQAAKAQAGIRQA